MKYTAIDGHIMTSSPSQSVSYECLIPENINYTTGTFTSFETTSDVTGNLVQIKIVRVLDSGIAQTTITESTQSEIDQYIIDCQTQIDI